MIFTAAGLLGIAVSVTGNETAQRFGRARVVAVAMGGGALLSLLAGWEKQYGAGGGRLVIDWETLRARFHTARPRPRASS